MAVYDDLDTFITSYINDKKEHMNHTTQLNSALYTKELRI